MFPIYVVIVDSDPRFLEIATRFLQKREGLVVYSAVSSSNEILRQASVFEPDIVLYNLDESDPKSLDTIRKLRSRFTKMTIIVISQPENESFKQSIIEAGATDIVQRYAMNLESLPAIWSLISMYKHRYGEAGVGTIPGINNPLRALPPSPKVNNPRQFVH